MRSPYPAAILLAALTLRTALPLPAEPPAEFQWEPILALTDEFDGPELDRAKWFDRNPGWAGHQPGWFSRDNFVVKDGVLQIIANLQEPPADLQSQGYQTYATANLMARVNAHYGYYEVRAKAMNSLASSAFWFSHFSETRYTELDVFEICGAHAKFDHTIFTTAHHHNSPEDGAKHWQKDIVYQVPFRPADDFHLYGMEWDEKQVKFYLDGKVYFTVENTTWHEPHAMMLDSETLTEWFGPLDQEKFPGVFTVDYVRAWQKK